MSTSVRWHDLVEFIVSWALRRRPEEERNNLIAAAQASEGTVAGQQEVPSMGRTIAEALMDEARIMLARELLRSSLEERFGPLPQALVERIDTSTDLERLKRGVRHVSQLASLDDLDL
jgi:hypothetical protein